MSGKIEYVLVRVHTSDRTQTWQPFINMNYFHPIEI